jgi:hypothetical protein
MKDCVKSPRLPMLLALVVTGVVAYILGASGTKVGLAQGERTGQVGTYQFSVQLNPEQKLLEAMLLDTRTGAVYTGGFDQNEQAIVWKPYVEPKFAKK